MTEWLLPVWPEYLDLLLRGTKTIEARPYKLEPGRIWLYRTGGERRIEATCEIVRWYGTRPDIRANTTPRAPLLDKLTMSEDTWTEFAAGRHIWLHSIRCVHPLSTPVIWWKHPPQRAIRLSPYEVQRLEQRSR